METKEIVIEKGIVLEQVRRLHIVRELWSAIAVMVVISVIAAAVAMLVFNSLGSLSDGVMLFVLTPGLILAALLFILVSIIF